MKNINPDLAQTEFDFSENNLRNENDEIDYQKVTKLFIREFNALPPIFSFDNLQLRDISSMSRDKEYCGIFLSNFFEEFRDRLDDLESDWEVKGSIENSTSYLTWFKCKYEIAEYLIQKISDTEEDGDLNENELIKKYSKNVRIMLLDFEQILMAYAKQYSTYYESDLNESFIASAMVQEYNLNWREWMELKELTKCSQVGENQ